jgi:hypothetical protein
VEEMEIIEDFGKDALELDINSLADPSLKDMQEAQDSKAYSALMSAILNESALEEAKNERHKHESADNQDGCTICDGNGEVRMDSNE